MLNYPSYTYQRWHGSLLAIAVLTFDLLFNCVFAQKLHIMPRIMLLIHVFGFVGIVSALWATSPIAPSREVWTSFKNPGWNDQGTSFLVGLLATAVNFLGFDSAGRSDFPSTDCCESGY